MPTFALRFLGGYNKSFNHIMNQYETVFILTPVLSEQQMKEAVKDYEKFLKKAGAKIVNSENWGMRKLAYLSEKNLQDSITCLNTKQSLL